MLWLGLAADVQVEAGVCCDSRARSTACKRVRTAVHIRATGCCVDTAAVGLLHIATVNVLHTSVDLNSETLKIILPFQFNIVSIRMKYSTIQ